MSRIRLSRASLAGLFVLLVVVGARAGAPFPPFAPPTASMRSPIFASDLPLVISTRGSYYLAQDVSAATGGITINADGVTLDLMGLTLQGTSGDGITVNASDVTVRNGVVTDWPGSGIGASGATHGTFESLRLADNGSNGLIAGAQSRVTDCTVRDNGSDGIHLGADSVVSRCIAESNGDDGIDVAAKGGTVSDSAAANNGSNGFELDGTASVSACVARFNGAHGFDMGGESTLVGCTSTSNTMSGFQISFGSTVQQCTSRFNDAHGIEATSTGNIILNCLSNSNGGSGFELLAGCLVSSCQARNNAGDGIKVTSECVVEANLCDSNEGDAGIHATGSNNRIVDNSVTNSDDGILIDAAGTNNFVGGNLARGNLDPFNFDTSANTYGTIVIGNGVTSATRWANFRL